MSRLVPLLTLALFWPAPARAKKCIAHAPELLELDLQGVYQGKTRVPTPAFFEDRATLTNPAGDGKTLLLQNEPEGHVAKLFALRRALPPAKVAQAALARVARKRHRTACATDIPYRPIRPGLYRFQAEQSGTRRSLLVGDPALTVSPDRRSVELRFTIKKLGYVARYRVACARYPVAAASSCRPAPKP
jgi:hypothetical protein